MESTHIARITSALPTYSIGKHIPERYVSGPLKDQLVPNAIGKYEVTCDHGHTYEVSPNWPNSCRMNSHKTKSQLAAEGGYANQREYEDSCNRNGVGNFTI